ncbi:nuclear hormone receptor E75-like [Tachypleus tridentatus]|uniref:nuclear hormone receptor E75-like n=1 Tax=Tachypleus tridentatus TaxID=6853 RepID=UPI003FD67CBA
MVVVYSLIRTGRTYKLVRRRCFKQGFFRRSTLQKLQYRSCGKNQQCSIGRINRNGCQHCRLRKCIAVGMSRNAVRFGRVPNQEKAKILTAVQKVNVKSQDKALKRLNSELEDENRLVNTILSAYEDAFVFSRDNVIVPANKESDFNHCLPQLAYPLQPGSNPLAIGTNSNNEDFSGRFSTAIGGIVEFAKKIPGFNLLPQDDQKTLLKAGVFEVLLVRLACTLDTQDNSMVCLNGQRLQRGKIHPTSSAFFLLDSMFEFAERLNSMKLVVRELGLFNAIVLIAPDRPDLQNADLVSAAHKKLADVLQKVLTSRQCENLSYFTEVMKMIRDLRTLHCQSLLAYKVEPQSMEDLKPMVSESSILRSSISHLQALLRPDNQFLRHSERNITSPAQNILGYETVDYIKDCNGRLDSKSGMTCSDKEKNLFRSLSFTNTHNLENIVPEEHGHISDLHSLKKSVDHTFEQNVSSGDESYISYGSDSPKQMHNFKLKRPESPFDSGIESGLEHGHVVTPNNSICSSPQSLEEKAKGVSEFDEKHDSQNHMSVLKRALEAPPLVNTSLMMEDLCKPHKKFHAAHQDLENFTTTTSLMTSVHGHCQTKVSLSNDHSTLIATLKKPSQFLNEEQIKRSDFIHNIIMRTESVSANIAVVNSGSIPVSAGADNNLMTQSQVKKDNEKTVYNIDCAGSMGIPQTPVFVDNDQSKQKVMVYPSSYCITGQIRETLVSNGFPQVESSHTFRKSHSNPRVFNNNYTTIVSAPLVTPPLGNITDFTTPLDLTKRSFIKEFEP